MEQTSTVAAIATPNAAGGIGIVRISGGDAIAVADKVFSAVSGKPLSEAAGYSAHFGTVSLDGKPIDEAIALVFRVPKSYTGEDTVELSCHGGVYIVRQVLRAVLNAGAQPAGPGEFTKRAFLNGRIDLAKAESVMSLISAQGEQAASAAFNTLEGRLSGRIESVAHSIINVCAHLSAWVDYPDEDIEELSTDELEKTFSAAQSELESLISGFENGKAVTQGVDTVIVGRPNVGKSTLMNLLSGCERSIVTDVPGTTRDIVEQTVRVGENLLRLADTAGIRDTDNKIESIGVELAKKRLSRAELVIAVFDGAQKLTDEDMEIIDFCSGRRSLAVVNKSDLGFVCDTDYIKSRFGAYVELSAKTAQGGGELEKVLSDLLGTSNFDPSAAALTSERQRNCCVRALDSIKEARSALESGVTLDAVNVCADCAVDALLELTGERAGEAVVNEVFSHDAINRDAKIAFQYFTWDEHKQKKLRHDGKIYRISPWALTWDDENYYMIGYDSDENKIKHYRVDKMTKIQPTEEKRDGAEFFADFDMALYSKQTFGMYGGREETVTLRCENKLANVMIDKFGFDTAFSNITDTHFDMRVKVFVSPVFLTWIMNFGADVTVLSPESVKDELTALASDVLAQYK
ncbi:tRNA modification GTPase MnmE [Ruminococcus sp. CAG:177]|nr:tRNA modification GTPase MnmE [Ruminococcus sp. CAG:177]